MLPYLLKHTVSRIVTNLKGWITDRKIIVIESDDWGSIRMPSSEIYNKCLKAGFPVDQEPYERYDCLESEEDLDHLFDLLLDFKDKKGNPPLITANCVVGNPDFSRIRDDNFEKYHYEIFTETYKKYPKHSNSSIIRERGIEAKVFHPQYHCREHLNVSRFMNDLRGKVNDVLFGFEHNMPGCIPRMTYSIGNSYVEATRFISSSDKQEKLNYFLEGLEIFESIHGFKSKSIIPPNYVWSPDFNQPVDNKGVSYIQGLRKMWEPKNGKSSDTHFRYLGKRNQQGQIDLVRNATFEPSLGIKGITDPVNYCLKDIEIAFSMRKPAILSSHRLNYMGFIDLSNRDNSLKQLRILLSEVAKRWPDVEYMSSDQLGSIIQMNA